jgi:Holliday junction DNA helicase RuvA
VGRKKAQQLVLDLAEKLDDLLDGEAAPPGAPGAFDDAVRALVSLGYPNPEAERAVHAALKTADGIPGVPELIRAALGKVGTG